MPVPSPTPRVCAADARRLRDLLRIAIAGYRLRSLLPREDELMVRYGVPRPSVRAALELLTTEGLLRPGPAAHRVVAVPEYSGHQSVPGATAPVPRWVDRTGVAAPDVLADWLGVPVGSPCLRMECVSRTADGGTVLETHYLAASAAADLLAVPETGSFEGLLADAHLHPARTDTRSGPVPADPESAALLGVPAGAPLLGAERTTTDLAGRVLAASLLRAHPVPPVPAARTVDEAGAPAAQPDSRSRTASSESASSGVLSGR